MAGAGQGESVTERTLCSRVVHTVGVAPLPPPPAGHAVGFCRDALSLSLSHSRRAVRDHGRPFEASNHSEHS